MASLGFCKNRFSFRVLQRKHDRGAVLRGELARCGFLPSDDAELQRPLFGLHSRAPTRAAAAAAPTKARSPRVAPLPPRDEEAP